MVYISKGGSDIINLRSSVIFGFDLKKLKKLKEIDRNGKFKKFEAQCLWKFTRAL